MTAARFLNAHLFDPSQSIDGIGHIDIEDGVITAINLGTPPNESKIERVIDCKKTMLAPGIIDMRVQSADPGSEHLESLPTLLAAAAKGGITALACLPNTSPVIDEASTIDSLCLRASRIGGTRLYAYGAATKALAGNEMAELGLMAEAGAVGFTNCTSSIHDSLVMRRLLAYSNMLDKPFIQHCEDHALTSGGEMNEGEISTRLGLIGIPACAEVIMIERDIRLAKLTGAHYHVAHVSTRDAVNVIREAKKLGLNITCDTAPPYFSLNESKLLTYNTAFKLSPPLRSEDDRLGIVEGIQDGTIDAIASDHRARSKDTKAQPFSAASVGASGIETLFSITLELVNKKIININQAISLLTINPAKIFGINSPSLEEEKVADFIIFDENAPHIIKQENLKTSPTPFDGEKIHVKILATYVNGQIAFMNEILKHKIIK